MPTPQAGIFALGTGAHAYLEFDAVDPTRAAELVRLVAGLREPRTTIGGVNLVAGFRPELWASVAPEASPSGLTGFNATVEGAGGYVLPATQHDVVVWLTGATYDVVFDASRGVVAGLAPAGRLVHEMVGWPYHHDRDLTGFIDGTENPSLVEAAGVALVADGEPGAGGSVLLLQQWQHIAEAWEGLAVRAQEAVIGRRKSDSKELEPDPASSHVSRTDQDRFGRIFRRNIAYGSVADHGTIFVGFSAEQSTLSAMLDSMVARDGGPVDALTGFTRPLTGAYYFVPAVDHLAALGAPPS
jgi:porphyrinogen peroxidase